MAHQLLQHLPPHTFQRTLRQTHELTFGNYTINRATHTRSEANARLQTDLKRNKSSQNSLTRLLIPTGDGAAGTDTDTHGCSANPPIRRHPRRSRPLDKPVPPAGPARAQVPQPYQRPALTAVPSTSRAGTAEFAAPWRFGPSPGKGDEFPSRVFLTLATPTGWRRPPRSPWQP